MTPPTPGPHAIHRMMNAALQAATPRRCFALRHLAIEDLGVFEGVLQQQGFEIKYRQAGRGEMAPTDWQHADLVVVLGGPIGANDQDRYPWLAE